MSQTLKFGNGTWATKKGSTLAYNDEDGNFKPLPFTYTGAGKGTRVNKEGLIEVVENDRPRIDYTDSEDGVFLLEKAATNLVTYSEDFSNSYWTKSGSSVVSGFVSPDGTNNAFKLIEDTSTADHTVYKLNISISNGVEYTYSVFVKGTQRVLQMVLSGSFSSNFCNFDLSDGTIGDNTGLVDFNITSLSNDWYRCDVTALSNGTSANIELILAKSKTSSRYANYQGNGNSNIYIFGVQLEAGNASSYIPTQGNPQTRVQETASGSGNSEVFNDSQGILYANISYPITTSGSGNKRIAISNGTSSNRVMFAEIGNTGISALITSGGVNSAYITGNVNNLLSFKSAIKYRQNDFSLWVNGFEVGTDTSGLVPVGLSELAFDGGDNSNPFYGKTKEIAYYDTVLTDLELETLTSYRTWEAMVKELNLNIIHNE
jgi:hypothetical protein